MLDGPGQPVRDLAFGPDDRHLQEMQRQLANLQLKNGQVVLLQCFAEPIPMSVPPH